MPELTETSDIDFGNISQETDLGQGLLNVLDRNEEGSNGSEGLLMVQPASSSNQGDLRKEISKLAEASAGHLVDNELNY